ncbi:hypothetical protein BKA62DRAFT_667412 [Auriculariales sp. MPI-PUGE-AT-0066]|nr:hypothetical protein BKA62DRAFT_667412 [Auriculariales sp. MPI-PUGE-AT-0066]
MAHHYVSSEQLVKEQQQRLIWDYAHHTLCDACWEPVGMTIRLGNMMPNALVLFPQLFHSNNAIDLRVFKPARLATAHPARRPKGIYSSRACLMPAEKTRGMDAGVAFGGRSIHPPSDSAATTKPWILGLLQTGALPSDAPLSLSQPAGRQYGPYSAMVSEAMRTADRGEVADICSRWGSSVFGSPSSLAPLETIPAQRRFPLYEDDEDEVYTPVTTLTSHMQRPSASSSLATTVSKPWVVLDLSGRKKSAVV